MKTCCERFAKALWEQRITWLTDGVNYGINGCCGGGCFVVSDCRYCPYCGAKVSSKAASVCGEVAGTQAKPNVKTPAKQGK